MQKIAKFLESVYFIIIINLITIVCWYFQKPEIAFLIYILIMIATVLCNADKMIFATLALSGNLNYFSKQGGFSHLFSTYFPLFLPLGILAMVVLVLAFIKNRKHRPKIQYKNTILYGLVAILVANILSLFNVKDSPLFMNAFLGIGQFIGYALLFFGFMNIKNEKSQLYISQAALLASLAISVELVLHFLGLEDIINKSDYNLGWGVSNSIAMFFSVLMPVGMYWYYKNQKNFFVLFIIGINAIFMLFMLSRGSYLTVGILTIPFIVMSFFLVDSKKTYVLHIAMALLLCSGIGFLLISKFDLVEVLAKYLQDMDFLDPNGREPIYQTGIELFKKYPLFGAGSYSGMTYLQKFSVYTYHNYWIHTVATTGIVGLAAFLFYLFGIAKECLVLSKYNILVIFSVLVICIHGMVDNTFYNPKIMIFLSLVLPLLSIKNKVKEVEVIHINDEN